MIFIVIWLLTLWLLWPLIKKRLMTDPKENNEFCFPRLSMFPEAKLKETLKSRGTKTQCFPRGKSLSRTWKKKTAKKSFASVDAGWLTSLPRFRRAWSNQVQVESSSCCFPRELVSFDQWHLKGSPIGKLIRVVRYNKTLWYRRESSHFFVYLVPQFQTESSWKL